MKKKKERNRRSPKKSEKMGTKKDRGAGMKERKEDETKMSSDVLQPHPHTDYNLQERPTNTLFFRRWNSFHYFPFSPIQSFNKERDRDRERERKSPVLTLFFFLSLHKMVSPVGFLNSCAEEMKKGFDGFNKSQAGSGETKADFKHRTLLDEFLELQKEFVAKKRKLKTAKQRRDMLMGEILFLRRRHRYLLKCQSCDMELAKDESCDMELAKDEGKAVEGERYSSGYEARKERNHLKSRSNLNLRYDEVQGSNGESATKGKLRIGKTPNDYLIDDKRVGKKKLYRHGRVTVKV